ncbi:MAG: hypothetical protein LUD48_04800 [Prevotella sp.]|nr:hypothetical protein [Prevotella sp.]
MDIELEKRINEAIAHLQSMLSDKAEYELMDPIAKMMLVALLYEVQKIHDYIEGIASKLTERFCEDFIPRQEVGAMPAISLVAPTFKKNKNTEMVTVEAGVSFTYKINGSKAAINYIPVFRNMLIPFDDIYILTPNKLTSKEHSIDVTMECQNTLWIGINTKAEIESLEGFSLYLRNVTGVYPEQIRIVGSETKDIEFSTMNKLEDIEMIEPFSSQQVSGSFLSILSQWKEILQDLSGGVLLYITDKLRDRDIYKKISYPRVFQNWLESEVLDCFKEDTLWLEIEFPENYKVSDEIKVIMNTFPIVNVEVNTVTLTQATPVAKLQKQDNTFFISVIETSNASYKQGFLMNSEEFVVRDFDAHCYHDGDLYRDIRNLYNHFVEDYYAFIEYNGLKDGQEIKRLKELVNKIGKSVGKENTKFKYDSGTYVMKNINSLSQSTVTKVSYMSTQGEQGNMLRADIGKEMSAKLECKKMPIMESNVSVVESASGGRDKATADQRYELIRYYALTNDRLYTRMDIDAFVRKELVAIYGKEELKRIAVKIRIEGAAGKYIVQRGIYVDLEFKDKKNYLLAEEKNVAARLQRKIQNKSCISMPITVKLYDLN